MAPGNMRAAHDRIHPASAVNRARSAVCSGMIRALLPLLLLAGRAGAQTFPFEAARASVAFTAFHDGDKTWTTCAALVLDPSERLLAVPLQCAGQLNVCRAAPDVALGVQIAPADFQRWLAAGATCRVVKRVPERNLALLRADQPWPSARAPAFVEQIPPLGSDTWTLGFPEQIPAFLSKGAVAAVVTKVRITGVPPGFQATMIAVAGARAGSEGSPLFDPAGRVLGLVIAHSTTMNGGYAIPAADLRSALQKK
jgi:hypothetical protein